MTTKPYRALIADLYGIPLERMETDRHHNWRHLAEAGLMLVYLALLVIAVLALAHGGGLGAMVILVVSVLAFCNAFKGWMTHYNVKGRGWLREIVLPLLAGEKTGERQ